MSTHQLRARLLRDLGFFLAIIVAVAVLFAFRYALAADNTRAAVLYETGMLDDWANASDELKEAAMARHLAIFGPYAGMSPSDLATCVDAMAEGYARRGLETMTVSGMSTACRPVTTGGVR